VSENRVLRRIFGPRRDEVTREWRKLYNEELNDLYWSPNIIRVIKEGRRDDCHSVVLSLSFSLVHGHSEHICYYTEYYVLLTVLHLLYNYCK
jgi:hypothetical protein